MLQFRSRTVANVIVADFTVPGLSEGPELEDTSETLHGMIGITRGKNMIIDLSRVKFVASSAMAVLISLKRKVDSNGGQFILCGLHQPVLQVLRLSGLDRAITVHATQDEALAALGAPVG